MEFMPPELLDHAFSYLVTKQDLCSLCVTSKAFRAVAEQFLYRDITFDKHKRQNISNTKIERYCRRATFALGNEEVSDFDDETEESVEAGCAEIVLSDAQGDEVFQVLAYLRKVQELVVRGNRKVSIGQYAKPAHGFPELKTLRLQNSTMKSLDLYRFAPFLQYPSVTSLYGSPIIPNLGYAIEPKSLALHAICLESSVLPFGYATNLFVACRSLERFEFYAEDGMPAIESVNPHQLVTILARHKETLQYLDIDYGLLQDDYISRPEHESWTIGNKLATFNTLSTLIVEYDAIFGCERFARSVPEQISGEIFPPSIRTLKVSKCPPTSTTEHSLRSIVDYMQRHPDLNDVTIDWFCEVYEKDTINIAALQVIEQALSEDLAIRMTYVDVMDKK